MNVQTINITKKKAEEKYKEYLEAVKENNLKQDREMKEAFYHAKNGKKLIDLLEIMKNCGNDSKGRPALAISRADQEKCIFYCWTDGSGSFSADSWNRIAGIRFPRKTFGDGIITHTNYQAIVPSIPYRFRPKTKDLRRYYILWEAEWETVPRDPILLKKISKYVFVVLAAWDLTEIERSILK